MRELIYRIRRGIAGMRNKVILAEIERGLDRIGEAIVDPIGTLESRQLDEHQISRLADLIDRESRRLIELQRAEWQRIKDTERSVQEVADYNARCANVATTLAKVTGAE